MKVKELILALEEYNQEADIEAAVNNKGYQFSLVFAGDDGCVMDNCDSVMIYIDNLNNAESRVN